MTDQKTKTKVNAAADKVDSVVGCDYCQGKGFVWENIVVDRGFGMKKVPCPVCTPNATAHVRDRSEAEGT